MSTWSGNTGGADDCQVTNNESNSPSNSIVIIGPQAGGTTDAMVVFPSNYTSGRYTYTMKYEVASGKGAYFNLQSNGAVPGTAWLSEIIFAADGTGYAVLNGQNVSFSYTNGAWIDVECDLNLNTDQAHIYIGGVEVGEGFQISLESDGAGTGSNKSFGGINFYSASAPAPAVGDCEYYVDDISLVEMTGVGITETALNPEMTVYPSPTSGNFTVSFEDLNMKNANVVLFDVLGKVVYTERRHWLVQA